MRRLLTRIWPSRKSPMPIANPVLESEAKQITRSPAERILVSDSEFKTNFEFTEQTVIEYASLFLSQDPVFRDEFTYFAGVLKDLQHPGVLTLLHWGEKDGRLYRIWRKRRFQAAISKEFCNPAHFDFHREQLIMLLDAMESLHCKGVPLERFSPRTIGRDPHLYIARLPMTAKSKAFESTGDSLGLRTDFYSALPPGYPRGAGLAFLIQLGCFASYWLCGKFPIDQVPLIEIQKKLKRQKRELDISPEITAVIHRLVEYDLEKAYPTSADGVRALKEVLEG